MKIRNVDVPRAAVAAGILSVAVPVAVAQASLSAAVLSLVLSAVFVYLAVVLTRQAIDDVELWYEAAGERCGWCGDSFDPRVSRFADYCSRWCAESDDEWETLGEIVARHRAERYEAIGGGEPGSER